MAKVWETILTVSLSAALLLTTNVDAAKKPTSDITYQDVYEAQGNPNASQQFIDASLQNTSRPSTSTSISPEGEVWEQYSYSYYAYGTSTIKQYDCGPISKQTFLLSVAKGETDTLKSTVTISGTVTYSTTVSVDIKNVVNAGLTGSASGTVSKVWDTTKVYTGPAETSPYNSRNYYSAVQFDLYNVTVKKYDVYKVYNGSVYQGTTTYYSSTSTINDVRKPKIISYSRDVNY